MRTVVRLVTKWTHSKRGGTLLTPENFVLEKQSSEKNTQYRIRIPNSSEVFYQVRDFVTYNRAARAHITATEVTAFMEQENIISIKYDENGQHEKLDYNAALRAVRRYLSRNQFKRGKATGKVLFNSQHVYRRNEYESTILENRAKPECERLRGPPSSPIQE